MGTHRNGRRTARFAIRYGARQGRPGMNPRRRRPPFVAVSAPVAAGLLGLALTLGGSVTASGPGLAGGVNPVSGSVSVAAPTLSGRGGAAAAAASATARLRARRADAVTRDEQRAAAAPSAEQARRRAVERRADARTKALTELAAQAEAQAERLRLNQWVMPLSGYRISAPFGATGLWANGHTGLDLAAPSGTPLVAIANGVVTEAGYDGAYGYKTVLRLEDGTELWYAHQSAIAVGVGEQVAAGELIGYVGSTGRVTGPHLHLEYRPGDAPLDPYDALVAHGLRP